MADAHRKIYFLYVVSPVYDFGALLEEMDKLSNAEMYSFIDGSGGGIFLKPLEHSGEIYQGTICRLRMNSLPSLGRQGERMTEQLAIAEDQGLVECTHFTYFSRSKIIAMEYNHYGPKSSTLEWHITDKINELHGEPCDVNFQPIFDEEVMRVLSENYELRMLQMTVPKEKIGNLAQFDTSIYSAFENAKNFGEGAEVELILKLKRGNSSRTMSGDTLLDKIRRLPGDPQDTFNKLKVKVKRPDEQLRAVDLLEGKFVVDVIVPTAGRGNEVNGPAIFLEMREAYQQNRDDLLRMSEHESLD